jgi:hypothetical protein
MPDPDAANPSCGDKSLNERIVDAVLYVPAGIAMSLGDELPKLAARGRGALEVKVSSARAVGELVVKAGADEIKRRSASLIGHRPAGEATQSAQSPSTSRSAGVTTAEPRTTGAGSAAAGNGRAPGTVAGVGQSRVQNHPPEGNGHIPEVSTLSIPGFDTLSASQVVQRLDGLNRTELVSVRAYEASTRGRRTILKRVDQLLDERY